MAIRPISNAQLTTKNNNIHQEVPARVLLLRESRKRRIGIESRKTKTGAQRREIGKIATTYLVPPSTGDCRLLSGTLVLALGLNEALPLEFCDGALPDVLLPVGAELTVEVMGLSGRQSKRAYVVEQFTTQAVR